MVLEFFKERVVLLEFFLFVLGEGDFGVFKVFFVLATVEVLVILNDIFNGIFSWANKLKINFQKIKIFSKKLKKIKKLFLL